MSALAHAIFAALVVFQTAVGTPIGVRWCRPDCSEHAARVAAYLEAAAYAHKLDPFLLAALAEGESSFDPARVGKLGERGLLQVHPRSPWGHAATNDCKRSPATCDYIRAYYGAAALADGVATCRSTHAAIGKFKTGRCVEGPIGARIMRRARQLRGER